ncbi:alpha/beta hydrolase family protein [Rhizoctonia solani]|uniref:Alpha/beta hydrolase family protein n=1 Tax=Rhizoctonia solani TaxID=456999 RepID=A0A8H8NS90_9AGAM|nr:alpha/beta hydrolase family protein [Rhizoctonia solani]QRW17685.1 alpha/beta hydrolase family protein [Rhizoctonia solani]
MSALISSNIIPETTIVPLSAGHTLEVDIYTALADTINLGAQKIAVLCHPWSWLGGCKDDPVLESIAVTLNVKLNMHVLVPNARSVGNSTGRASFSGKSEAADLEELTQWYINKAKDPPQLESRRVTHMDHFSRRVILFFLTRYKHHILLSYPLSPLPLLTFFNASTYREHLSRLVSNPQARVLILFGDKDQFTGISNYQSWANNLEQAQGSSTSEAIGSGAIEVKMVTGADHFWRGRFNRQMTEAIITWLEKYDPVHRSSGRLATTLANDE